MKIRYQKYFGIDKGTQADDPFHMFTLHRAENLKSLNLLQERRREFLSNKIGSLFNISWTDYIDQPRDELEGMLEDAIAFTRREVHNQDAEVTELERKLNQR